jgi:N-acetylmuramic acid 6-phosphate etherase
METERRSERFRGLDAWDTSDVVAAMLEGQMAAVAAVRAAGPAIAAAADAATARLGETGRLVYAGAGTSGRLAVQDGVELTPTFDWPPERCVFLMAGGSEALFRAVEGAEDDAAAGEAAVDAASVGPGDVAIGLAASGTTPYVRAAMARARALGALTVAAANNPGAPLLAEADHAILLDTGAEAIAGSTRMKAGTAQRALLTVLSSAIMVRLQRTYDGYMVDLRATNAKLERRSLRMLMALSGAPEPAARQALAACGGRVKPAVLALRLGLSPEGSAARLADAGGSLRAALGERP